MKKPEILVVGSMNMDLNIYGMQKIPNYGESVSCSRYAFSPGGKGSNQALAIVKLGGSSTIVGAIGRDDYGKDLRKKLDEGGVDTRFVFVSEEEKTGLAVICVEKQGLYNSYCALGANMVLDASSVEKALRLKKIDMVMMQFEMPLETIYRTYELSRKNDIPVFIDAGPPLDIELERLGGAYIISPNEAETASLTGIEPTTERDALRAAKILHRRTSARYVILKLGKRGAFVYDGTDEYLDPPVDIEAVDSTAAGDTFNAALGVALCRGRPMKDALAYAQTAAAICVSRHGALLSIPLESEVLEFQEATQ